MQLVEEFNHFLNTKNFKKAFAIYFRMESSNKYPQEILDASLNKIQTSLQQESYSEIAYGFKDYLNITQQDSESVNPHKFYSHIDEINENLRIRGWCFSSLRCSNRASFLVTVEGSPVCIERTSIVRDGVSKMFKTDGYWGYEFTLPSVVRKLARIGGLLKVEIRSPYGKNYDERIASIEININGPHVSNIFPANHEPIKDPFENLNKEINANKEKSKSIILLNFNGGKQVIQSIQSILARMKPEDELIIVDHCSHDGSLEQIKEIYDKDNIIVWERDKKYTFTESCNSAAKMATKEAIIFMNNDIVIEDGSFNDLVKILGYQRVEIVGGSIYDTPHEEFSVLNNRTFPRCLRHRGVSLKFGGEYFVEGEFIDSPLPCYAKDINYLEVEATSGAIIAMRREFFLEIGGFNDKYFDGLEDIDICLRASLQHDSRIVVSNKFKVLEYRTNQHQIKSSEYRQKCLKAKKNNISLGENFAPVLRRYLKRKNIHNQSKTVNVNKAKVAFIVSDLSLNTSKGDVFSAYELAHAISNKFNCECFFVLPNKKINCNKFDIIINLLHTARIHLLQNLRNDTIIIAWMRNWFDKWCNLPDIDLYDLIYCSSKKACSYVEGQIKYPVKYLPLAASADAVKMGKENRDSSRTSSGEQSYTFIGSFFDLEREITQFLDPQAISYRFKLYGHNWEKDDKFSKYTLGPVDYFSIIEKYLETDLVIDDANIATKKWGSVNCRVFDSLALGINVITNGIAGSTELFGGRLPIYNSKESLKSQIQKLLEEGTTDTTKWLQNFIIENHTYEKRAEKIFNDINDLVTLKHIRIHTSIPQPAIAPEWGDLYLAREIRYALQKKNFRCNISVGENIERRLSSIEDLAVNLRGIESIKPLNKQKFLNWLISHPDSYTINELIDADHIAVASNYFKSIIENLRSEINQIKPLYIPQFSTIKPSNSKNKPICDFIFVGNTRSIFRESVQYAIKLGLNLKVIGSGWENYIEDQYILENFVSNSDLEAAYKLGRVALCDHWNDMKRFGFVSNRIFDCLSIGMPILTDYSEDIDDKLTVEEKDYVFTYKSFNEFSIQAKNALDFSKDINGGDGRFHSDYCREGLSTIIQHIKYLS